MKLYSSPANHLGIWVLLLFGLYQNIAIADTEIEKRYLADILREMKTIHQLITQAEKHQEKNERPQEKFRYDWLRADLKKIEHGIREKLTLPNIQPRNYTAIQGQYLSDQEETHDPGTNPRF